MMSNLRTPIRENDQSADQRDMSESSKSKIDPSFKSKRYRDKLRTEIKALEGLLPVDRTALSRKLDSQTVFRLVIAYFRSKIFFKASGVEDPASGVEDPTSVESLRVQTDSGSEPTDQTASELTEALDEVNKAQLLDGFLLMLTADGTVLFVSDAILQYLGFNQVDLMHRCVYGVIHPDDHHEVKDVLEHTLNQAHAQATSAESSDSDTEAKEDDQDMCKPVSFLCRMKCFNGTSAGYLKMHCSGKITHLSQLSKSTRSSCQVLFLFCHPFMINTTEMDQESKQNVFWSKHDLDLSIRELDKKAVTVLGYHSGELEGRSLYSLVHPEDAATCATCHKTLTESNEVQTIYFRLEIKDGGWLWVQSRGKVICKNSKKFSIVFSHCPVREEDSTYLQQEAVLRQRYAINDLMCLAQTSHCGGLWKESANCTLTQSSGKRLSSPSFSTTQEDSFLAVHNLSGTPCPSSWHALSDRHSPILPSSHVAHKISQREKQAQFQEFKRRQMVQQDQIFGAETWEDQFYQRRPEFCEYSFMDPAQDGSRWNLDAHLGYGIDFERIHYPQSDFFSRYHHASPFQYPSYVFNPWQQAQCSPQTHVPNMPPSPPPSPPRSLPQRLPQQHHPLLPHPTQTVNCVEQMQVQPALRDGHFPVGYIGPLAYHEQAATVAPCIQDLQKTAEKYLNNCEFDNMNMPCRPMIGPWRGDQTLKRKTIDMPRPKIEDTYSNDLSENKHNLNQNLKVNDQPSQSCAYAAVCRVQNVDRSQSETRTEGHMMIVEQGQPMPARGFSDLPSIGSFLEYLNEV